jgi:hypothetical protein
VLGFSNAICNTMNADKENEIETKRINALVEQVQTELDLHGKHFGFSSDSNTSRIASQFSDSIIVSYSANEESALSYIRKRRWSAG